MDISKGSKLFDDDLYDDPDYPHGPDSAQDLRIQGVRSPERTPLSKLKPIRVAATSTSKSVDSKKPPKAKTRKHELIKIKHKVAMPSISIAFGNPSIISKEALVSSNNSVISINAANTQGAVYRSKNTLYKLNNSINATNVTITSKVPPTPVLRAMHSSAAEVNSVMSRYTNADGSSIYQMVKKAPETSAEEKLRYHTRLVDSPNNTSYYESVDLEYHPNASVISSSTSATAAPAPQPPTDASTANTAFPKRMHRFKKNTKQPEEIHDEQHMMDIMTHIKPAVLTSDAVAETGTFSNQQQEPVDDQGAVRSAPSSAAGQSRPSTSKSQDPINFDDEEELDNFDENDDHHEEVPLVSLRATVNPFFNKSTLQPHGLHSSSGESLGVVDELSVSDGFAKGLDPNVHIGDKDTLLMAEIAIHNLWDGEHLNSHFTSSTVTPAVAATNSVASSSSVTAEDGRQGRAKKPRSQSRSPSPTASHAPTVSVAAARSISPVAKHASVSVVIPDIKPEAPVSDSPKSLQRKQIAGAAPSPYAPQNKKPAGSPSRSHAFLRNNLIKAYNLPMLKLEALSDKELRQGPASHRDTAEVSDGKDGKTAAAEAAAYQSVSARDSVESRILPKSVKTRVVIPSHITSDPAVVNNGTSEAGKKSVRIADPKVQQQPATQAVASRILRKGPATSAATKTTTIVTDYYDLLKGSRQVASTAVQILSNHTQPPTLSDTVAACETLQSVTGLVTPASTAPTTGHREGGLGAVTAPGGKHVLHVARLDFDLDNTSSVASGSTFKPHASNMSLTKDAHYILMKNKQAAAQDKRRFTTNPVDGDLSSHSAGVSSYESFIAHQSDMRDADRDSGGHKFIKIVAPAAMDDDEVELMSSEYVLRPSTHHAPKPKTHLESGGGGTAPALDDSFDSQLDESESPARPESAGGALIPSTADAPIAPGVAQDPLSIIKNLANAAILTQYEYEEILDFAEVYFIGYDKYLKIQPHILIPELFLMSEQANDEGMIIVAPNEERVHTTSEHRIISGVYNDAINGIFNNGFDNEDTTYIATKGDHVGYRYELLSSLGKGSFGDVFECLDHKTGKNVAVKIIKSKARFQEQAAHELAMLDYVRPSGHREIKVQHPPSYHTHSYHKEESGLIPPEKYHLINSLIVQYSDSFMFRNHRCFVFPIYSLNLYEYMKLKNFAGLPVSFVKKVAVQLLEALKYLRSIDVVHCDLKPENILLKDEKTVSIVMIDFGSSCKVNESKYMYIQSRFYRAPEVLMGIPYSFPIDMWSLACILPELRTSYPAFPGESERDQVAVIAEVLGEPPYSMYTQCTKKKELYNEFYKLVLYISPLGRDRALNTRTVSGLINARAQDQLFVSFIASILQWLPEKRLTPADALRHPWLLDKHESGFHFDSDATFQALTKGGTVSELLNNSADILLKEETSSAKMKEKSDLEKMEEFIEVFKFDDVISELEDDVAEALGVGQEVLHPLALHHTSAAEIAEEAGVVLMQTITEDESEAAVVNAAPTGVDEV